MSKKKAGRMVYTDETEDQRTSEKWVAGKTKSGKDLVVKPDGRGLFYVEQIGGGKKAKEFSGKFTGYMSAQKAVDAYRIKTNYAYRMKKTEKKEKKVDA